MTQVLLLLVAALLITTIVFYGLSRRRSAEPDTQKGAIPGYKKLTKLHLAVTVFAAVLLVGSFALMIIFGDDVGRQGPNDLFGLHGRFAIGSFVSLLGLAPVAALSQIFKSHQGGKARRFTQFVIFGLMLATIAVAFSQLFTIVSAYW